MGAYRPAMMPLQSHVQVMVSMTGKLPHDMGVPDFPQHPLPVMPGFPGMMYFGKSAVIASPPATQLLPVYQSDLLEGLPVPIGLGRVKLQLLLLLKHIKKDNLLQGIIVEMYRSSDDDQHS